MRLRNKLLTLGCVAAAAGALVTSMACNEHELSPFSKSLSAGKTQSMSSGSARAVDILFVVDNSDSMADEQRDLDKNFSAFLDKLINANADFHLAVASTTYNTEGKTFHYALNADGEKVLKDSSTWTDAQISALKAKCGAYFGPQQRFIASNSEMIRKCGKEGGEECTDEERTEYLKDLFRCQAILGTGGSSIERGLATMAVNLTNENNDAKVNNEPLPFKRPGSILSIVFVTDENDCSDVDPSLPMYEGHTPFQDGGHEESKCELERNIEDSCIITREDRIVDTPNGSTIRLASGDNIEYNGVTKSLRDWCVQGDEEARKAIVARKDALLKSDETVDMSDESAVEKATARIYSEMGINSPDKGFANNITPRNYYYNVVLNKVLDSNRAYYERTNADLLAEMTAEEKEAAMIEYAKADIIIASVINRDMGTRYNTSFKDAWCGPKNQKTGSQGYRYQLFAEMFGNDPIYAPICCRNETFKAEKTSDTESNIVCEKGRTDGENGQFGPALGAIGTRIGKAVNTICTDTPPLTCIPADCEAGKASCPCLYGCNSAEPYFQGTDREYYLCNEFQLSVGTVDAGKDAILSSEDPSYTAYKEGVNYDIVKDSNYCYMRTGSPIQINLSKNEAGKQLIIQYPKRVSAVK